MASNFSFIASHELKAPLAAMKWSLHMLLRGDVGALSEQQLELIEEVYKNNEQMIGLIDSMTDVESLTQEHPEIEQKEFDLAQTLTHLLDQVSAFAKARNVVLKLNTERGALPVRTDEKRIHDTMHNFINNAIKYTPGKGEVQISLRAMTKAELQELFVQDKALVDEYSVARLRATDFAVFQVKDSGIGISPTQQANIFQKFFRSEDAVKMSTRGTGLGLFIDKIVIELSGGVIWFHSKEKLGSTFAFALPVLREGAAWQSK